MRRPPHRELLGGAGAIAVGLTFAGAGTLAMLGLAARAMPPSAYAAFAVWWTAAALLNNVFGVFEAYLARLVVTETAAGRTSETSVSQVAARTILVAVGLGSACLLLTPTLARTFFADSVALVVLLPVFLSSGAVQAVQRGAAIGHRRYRAVGVQYAADGIVRGAATVTLLALGADEPGMYAAAACVASATSVLAADRLSSHWRVLPRWRGPVTSFRPVLFLLVGAVGPVVATNGTAPWLAASAASTPVMLGAFVGGLTLSRIPTQFMAAAFGPLLAELSHAVEAGDEARFRALQRGADLASAVALVAFVATFATLGPLGMSLYLGPPYRLPVHILVLLAASSGLMLWAVVRQAGLGARGKWHTIATGWTVSILGLGLVLSLPIPVLLRAAGAPVAALAVALAILVLAGARRPRAHLAVRRSSGTGL